MSETTKKTQICGRIVYLGDYVEVDYRSGGSIKGEIVEIWSLSEDDHLQAKVESGWCFHDWDKITKHSRDGEGLIFP